VTDRRGPSKRQSQGDQKAKAPSHKNSPDPYCVFRHFKKIKNAPPTAYTYCKLRMLLVQEKATDAEIGEIFFSLLQKSPHPERGYIPAATFDQYFISEAALRMPSLDTFRLQKLVITKGFNRRQTVLAGGSSGGTCCQGDTVETARLEVIKWAEEKEHSPPELALASS
jgi:hypothetical protein